MGTRADFYIGRGTAAEWIGSIAYDGYPDGHPDALVQATSEAEFRAAVEAMLAELSHATRPAQGWPWPWETSHTTDYAYAWDGDVWISCFGHSWQTMAQRANDGEGCEKPEMPSDAFPNMTERANVATDGRSGMLILRM
jgi:hypothetical protein